MVWRLLRFFAYQLTGAMLGWWLLPMRDRSAAALLGVLMGGAVWVLIDLWRGGRLMSWLRMDELGDAVPRVGGIWRDVADRIQRHLRRQQSRTAENQARLDEFLAAIQASPNGVVLLDSQFRIEWCNATAAEHFGLDVRRDLMQHLANLVRDPVYTAYQAGGDFSGEIVIVGPRSEASRPQKLALQLHAYGQDRRLLLSRDVTALAQAEAMRRDFVANVSHEIRTPLTVLAGFVETLRTLELDQNDRQRYLGLMAQQAGRMQTLVDDLLTLSRLEGSPLPGHDEWLPLPVLLGQVEQEARELSAVLSGAQQQIEFPPAAAQNWAIAGLPSELTSALSNLVSNAIRYTPADARITVSWWVAPDGHAEVAVKDNGPGIAPEHLPRLTERFYRVDRSRSRETGGTGLGLAIVKHVAQRHGGVLRLDSQLGVGSVFTLELPASRIRPIGQSVSVTNDWPREDATTA